MLRRPPRVAILAPCAHGGEQELKGAPRPAWRSAHVPEHARGGLQLSAHSEPGCREPAGDWPSRRAGGEFPCSKEGQGGDVSVCPHAADQIPPVPAVLAEPQPGCHGHAVTQGARDGAAMAIDPAAASCGRAASVESRERLVLRGTPWHAHRRRQKALAAHLGGGGEGSTPSLTCNASAHL